jgi:hypothetical protein
MASRVQVTPSAWLKTELGNAVKVDLIYRVSVGGPYVETPPNVYREYWCVSLHLSVNASTTDRVTYSKHDDREEATEAMEQVLQKLLPTPRSSFGPA